ncbi:MAG: hypothetical protein HW407_370 [Bacteroidetes bacterium]|nr:hypothetical protein [Bacteroidota bacterium]
MIRLRGLILFLGASSLAGLSCNENKIVDPGPVENQPVFASSFNAFSFYVNADSFTFARAETLMFSGDSLRYALSVSGYAGGAAVVYIEDLLGAAIRSDSIQQDVAVVVNNLAGRIPRRCNITLTNFSGVISLSLFGIPSSQAPFLASDFPNAIGSTWTYAVYDSTIPAVDTLVTTIVGDTVLSSGTSARIWRLRYRSRTETYYVSNARDTVRLHPSPTALWINATYVFPMVLGSSWRGAIASDTNRVAAVGRVATLATTFPKGYLIDEQWGQLNDYGRVFTWLVPQVGIVKLHKREWGFGWANVTWELLRYTIVP